MTPELRAVLVRSVHEAARALIGWTLVKDGVGGVVVETEAYAPDDPASHSFGGKTRRNAAMFGPPGRLYVYRSYGVHWCANVVCEEEGTGAAVLIRALEPVVGLDDMRRRRGVDDVSLLCAGPGRVAQALAITEADDSARLDAPPFELVPPGSSEYEVVVGTRVGISRATERPWRYALKDSAFVSRPRPRA